MAGLSPSFSIVWPLPPCPRCPPCAVESARPAVLGVSPLKRTSRPGKNALRMKNGSPSHADACSLTLTRLAVVCAENRRAVAFVPFEFFGVPRKFNELVVLGCLHPGVTRLALHVSLHATPRPKLGATSWCRGVCVGPSVMSCALCVQRGACVALLM